MDKIKAVIFDLWDTLIPATIDFVHLKSLTEKQDMEMKEFIARFEEAVQKKKYASFDELRADFFWAFGGEDKEILEQELYEIFHNRFDKIYFFLGVDETLKKLRKDGYKLALMSNTENIHMQRIEEILKLREKFDYLGYSFDMNAIKPDPKTFKTVLAALKISPKEALMVGDSLRSDIDGAQKVGMHTCYIKRKERSSVKGSKPDYTIHSINEISMVLGDLNEKEN